jgi:ribosomal protein S18 acetylase RimI-like enzyme
MTAHPLLDDPAWHALGGRHARFGEQHGRLRRYRPEFASFAAAETPADRAALGSLIPRNDFAVLIIPEAVDAPDGMEVYLDGRGIQMVAENPVPVPVTIEPVVLGPADTPEIIALVELTQPGPFAARTVEIGRYVGLRDNGRLIAMAGERLQPPGYTEVSAVCTHPDYRGRGLGRQMISAIMQGILARGETPFLHTRAGNADAIKLYERLGFVTRTDVHFTVLKHIGASDDAIPTFLRPH